MSYNKTNWNDRETILSAANLNKIENQLEVNTNSIDSLLLRDGDKTSLIFNRGDVLDSLTIITIDDVIDYLNAHIIPETIRYITFKDTTLFGDNIITYNYVYQHIQYTEDTTYKSKTYYELRTDDTVIHVEKTVNLDNVESSWARTDYASVLSNKVDKVSGKGLSENDYTTAEKSKLSGIAAGAQVNILEGIQIDGANLTPSNKKVNINLATKANTSGTYPNLEVGISDKAKELIKASPTIETDATFISRISGEDISIRSGTANISKIKGRTLVKNQLINPANYSTDKTQNNVTFTKQTDGSIQVVVGTGGASANTTYTADNVSGRAFMTNKYLILGCPSGGGINSNYYISVNGMNVYDIGNGVIGQPSQNNYLYVNVKIHSGCPAGTYVFEPQLIDLTKMYGAGNEPTTVAEYYKYWGTGYKAYNTGTLVSSKPTSYKANGLNQFSTMNWLHGKISQSTSDPNYNYNDADIKVIGGMTYMYDQDVAIGYADIIQYDADGNMVGVLSKAVRTSFTLNQKCDYVRIRTYKSGGSALPTKSFLWLPWTDYTNLTIADWQPYAEQSLPISYVDSDNTEIFPDGLRSAGSVYDYKDYVNKKNAKVIGAVDLGTLNYTYMTATSLFFETEGLIGIVKNAGSSSVKGNIVSTIYETKTNSELNAGLTTNSIILTDNGKLRIVNSAYTTAAAFKTAMSGVYLYYELATEVVTDMSSTEANTIMIDNNGVEWIKQSEGHPVPIVMDIEYQNRTNIIEAIQLNGNDLPINNNKVNIDISALTTLISTAATNSADIKSIGIIPNTNIYCGDLALLISTICTYCLRSSYNSANELINSAHYIGYDEEYIPFYISIDSVNEQGTYIDAAGNLIKFNFYTNFEENSIVCNTIYNMSSKVNVAGRTVSTFNADTKVDNATLFDENGIIKMCYIPNHLDDVINFDKQVSGSGYLEDVLTVDVGGMAFCAATIAIAGTDKNKFLKNVDGTIEHIERIEPQKGIIYIGKTDNNTFAWSGSNLVEISKALSLGEASTKAYPGNKGKANADNIALLQTAVANITPKTKTVTIQVADWVSNSYTIALTGVTINANDVLMVSPTDATSLVYYNAAITRTNTENTITLTANVLPEAAITVNIIYIKGEAM